MVAQIDSEIGVRPRTPARFSPKGSSNSDCSDVMVQDGQRIEIQCINSTDFVVGKQTNFNGPVTIYACPTIVEEPAERVVIRDQIWTTATSKALGEEADKKTQTKDLRRSNSSTDIKSSAAIDEKTAFSLEGFREIACKPFCGIPYFILWVVIAVVILSGVIAATVQVSSGKLEPARIFIGDESHQYFRKEDWNGLNASSKLYIFRPTPYVVISHTAGGFCYETTTCQSIIRNIQKDQMSRTPPFADISSNFLIGGDGFIYEGRGWGVRSPHMGFVNNHNIDITLIGDFSVYDDPTDAQMDAVKKLISYGIDNCDIDANYTLLAHNQTTQTLSPGKNVYKIISTWEHFDSNPKSHLLKYANKSIPPDCQAPVPFNKTINHNHIVVKTESGNTTQVFVSEDSEEWLG